MLRHFPTEFNLVLMKKPASGGQPNALGSDTGVKTLSDRVLGSMLMKMANGSQPNALGSDAGVETIFDRV